MTLQETRRTGPRIVRDRSRDARRGRDAPGVESLLRSPALDFYGLLVVGGLLIVIGLVMVLSATSVENIAADKSPFADFLNQAKFALIGLPFVAIGALLPVSFYRSVAWPALVVAVVLQALVFVPGLGVEVNGNRNWIDIGGQRLQPSEVLKLALALWLGTVLATKRHLLNRWKHLLIPVAPVAAFSLGLVMLGHDLGTMMVMVVLVAGALWVAGVPKRVFALGAALAGAGVAALVASSPNRLARIAAWASGDCDTQGACYQSYHGLQGLAEGGFWGVGLGASRQKWGLLPHANNDYIFAIIGEELGLAGTLTVVALFALLAVVCARIIGRHPDPFVKITTAGIAAWLLGQALVNMGVVAGMLPVIGVPLPFVSAGGSALVGSMLALGVLLAFARNEPDAREAIGARARSLRGTAAVVPADGDRSAATTPRKRTNRKRRPR